MQIRLFFRRSLTMGIALAALSCAPAGATVTTTLAPAGCSVLPVAQPFLAWGDTHWYSLVPGQTTANFVGTGWTLSGGGSIDSVVRADGGTGTVLNLPSHATAVSPPICVSSDYPTARTMVRNLVGAEGVYVYVSYAGATFQNTGQVHGAGSAWTLSTPVNIHSAPLPGWSLVRFKFVAGGTTSRFQVYNFWVDPRMSR